MPLPDSAAPKIVLIDNYDSFTFNLAQLIGTLLTRAGRDEPALHVFRNDAVTVEQVAAARPTHLVLSPGPCTPREAGISTALVRRLGGTVPILGVCLGHQCIAAAGGATIERAVRVMHGKTADIHHDGRTLFASLPSPCTVMRYHSLVIRPETLPDEFEVSARSPAGEIMAIRHRAWPIEGVQFHPESYRTPDGPRMMANFFGLTVDRPA